MRVKLLVCLGLIAVLSLSALCLSCNEGDDLDQISQQITGTSSAPPPAGGADETPAPAPESAEAQPPAADAAGGDQPAEPTGDATAEPPAEPPAATDEGAAEPTEQDAAAQPEGDATEPAAEDTPAEDAGDAAAEAPVDDAAATADPAEGEEEASLAEEAEEELDPISRFEVMDPRDIIELKYEDLAEKQTTPSNPESEWFNERIGRVDPLTRVRSEVPAELRPPRAGESDQNEINTYLIAQAATDIVNAVAYTIQCDSVLQIGLEKQAIFILPGGRRTLMSEGQSTSFGAGYVEGIPLICSIACASISTDQVVLSISCYGQNTPTSISKNQIYIPRGFSS